MQTASGELNWNLLEGYLSPAFLNNLRQKVCRLEGKVRVGFTGEKSRIVASENSSDVYFVSFTGDAQFSCTCTTFKTFQLCSHTLASAKDTGDFNNFINLVVRNKTKRVTPACFSGGCQNAGKKPNENTRKRKNTSDLVPAGERKTLKETLEDVDADEQV